MFQNEQTFVLSHISGGKWAGGGPEQLTSYLTSKMLYEV